jgi:hypothetical protein
MNASTLSGFLAAVLLSTLSPQLSAQQPLPKAGAGEVITMTSKVISVDEASREVVLEGRNGGRRTIVAGPDVRNLSQVKPGDLVNATYSQAVAIELKKGGTGVRSADVKEDASRAKLGETPGGTVRRQVTLVGTVEEVDRANRLVSVKGPHGNIVDVAVSEETLGVAKVGDQVELVYTEALAIAVTPGGK